MISYDDMPEDNAELAKIDIVFPFLPLNNVESCPIQLEEILEYLKVESTDFNSVKSNQLQFLRTAQVAEKKFWIWRFEESDGTKCYVTVSVSPNGAVCTGYDDNFYSLSPEQYMLGDYYNVF